MKLISVGISALLCGVLSTAVQADEVWKTNAGTVTYLDEIGPTAVWSYGDKDNPGLIYILGLAKVYANRGQYDGYWVKTKAKTACDSERLGMNGAMTRYWGRFQIRFIDKDFPSRWEAVWSYCDGAAEAVKLKAEPVVADAQSSAR